MRKPMLSANELTLNNTHEMFRFSCNVFHPFVMSSHVVMTSSATG